MDVERYIVEADEWVQDVIAGRVRRQNNEALGDWMVLSMHPYQLTVYKLDALTRAGYEVVHMAGPGSDMVISTAVLMVWLRRVER